MCAGVCASLTVKTDINISMSPNPNKNINNMIQLVSLSVLSLSQISHNLETGDENIKRKKIQTEK